jgi:hypothetical protein
MGARVTSKLRPAAKQGIHVLLPRGTTSAKDGIHEVYSQRPALCRTQRGKRASVSSISELFWIPSQSTAQEWSACAYEYFPHPGVVYVCITYQVCMCIYVC